MRDHAAGADHAVFAQRMAADDRGIRADRSAFFDQRMTDLPVLAERTGVKIVRKRGVGADKDIVLDGYAVIDGNAVLDLAAIADGDVRVDLGVLTDDAAFADLCVFADLRIDPNLGAGAYVRFFRNICARMNEYVFSHEKAPLYR